jgi:hypothetical protein
MSRRRITFLSVTITLVMVGALLTSFFLSGWAGSDRTPIALPPRDAYMEHPAGSIPDPTISFKPYLPIGLDVSTAQNVVETLHRPSEYRCDIRVRWHWPGGAASRVYRLAVRGDLYAVREYAGHISLSGDEFLQADYITLMNDERQLRWTPNASDGVTYEGARGTESADDLCSIPTYEDLLRLPEDAITDIGYETDEDGGHFLVVDTQEELYIGRYRISMNTGLLCEARFYNVEDPSELVYSMEMTNYREGDPGNRYFIQPDGTIGL